LYLLLERILNAGDRMSMKYALRSKLVF
jgi:hypothetical protein